MKIAKNQRERVHCAFGSPARGARAIRVPISNANFVFGKQSDGVMTTHIHIVAGF